MKDIDSITLAVIANNLQWATEEMGTYLTRAAFSSNIKVRKDCSCAIYNARGDMLAQGTFIPVHLGIMSLTMKELLKVYPAETLDEGDILMHNNPYLMGSHLFDVMFFKPVFVDGELVAFTGDLAHNIDMGGNPISYVSKTIYEEGMIIPGVKIVRKGELQKDILRIIQTNTRTPYEVTGDMMAQIAANNRGEARIKALAEKYGKDKLKDYFDALLEYSEASMRAAIRAVPNGVAEYEDYLENDGIKDTKIKFKARVTIEDEDVYVDFDGSGEPAEGGHNCTPAMTYSATYYSIKAAIGSDVFTNTGAYRAIHVKMPDYPSIINAQMPSAVAGCTCMPTERICDVILGALSQIIPERVCAADGHWTSAGFIGKFPGQNRYFSYLETYAIGKGAKHDQDGANAHQSHMTNTANAPTEVIELENPLIVECYGLVNGSGGAGKFRGGLALSRELTTIPPASFSVMAGRPYTPPYGLFGGKPGGHDYVALRYADGTEERRTSGKPVPANTTMVMRTSGGGGWGDPKERDPQKVLWDVRNEYVSLQEAEEEYGCVIDPERMEIVELKR